MRIGKIKKAGVGLVAAAALAGGTAVAGAGIAAADPPDLGVSQAANDGQTDVTVETTDSNSGISVCMPALVSGETGLNILIDYNNDDYSGIVDELTNGDNVQFGEPASHNELDLGPLGTVSAFDNPSESTFTVDNGVYFLVGTCANPSAEDLGALFKDVVFHGEDPTSAILGMITDDITVQPVIVPNGIGSIAPALQFGSTASSALPALVSILGGGGLS